jgi:formate transporter
MAEITNRTPGGAIIDTLLPLDMALACEAAGAAKAGRDTFALVVLGVLAGAFIALGAMFMTVVLTGTGDLPWGVARLLAGLVFSLGLILVIVCGAELFTGDSLMIVACASQRITLGALLRAWSLVYAGNIAGAVGTAALVFLAGQHGFNGSAVGKTALAIAFLLGRTLQRARVSCRVDVVWGAKHDRQNHGHCSARCDLRSCRI